LLLVHPPKTVEIETRTIELEEKGVKLRLTVVDTPGFGDGLNSTERLNFYSFNYFILHRFLSSWKPILDFIDQQFLKYFQAETSFGIERKYVQDQRVHCCLYFLPPSIRG
jgi:septin family protein